MKILAVMGSPRGKGAGYWIIRKIEDRMKSMGDVEFTYLFLKDANLKPCTGCYTCMARGEDKCPLKDDRAAIEQELLTMDGIILSSPMYVDNVSSLMKNFIDRFAYNNHRPRFHRQKMLTVMNMAGLDARAALRAFKWVLGGARIVHELGISTPPWLQTERAIAKKERAIDAAAKKFYRACLDTSLPTPTFNNYLNFYIYQRLSSDARESLPADYAFYKNKPYYYDQKFNPVKAAVAKFIANVMMNAVKDKGPGNIPWPTMKDDSGL